MQSTTLDAYRQWLRVEDPQSPPEHYALLRLQRFESDEARIHRHARRQMHKLLPHLQGPHAVLARQLMAEVELAEQCLSHPQRKAAYDSVLRLQTRRLFDPLLPADRVAGGEPQQPCGSGLDANDEQSCHHQEDLPVLLLEVLQVEIPSPLQRETEAGLPIPQVVRSGPGPCSPPLPPPLPSAADIAMGVLASLPDPSQLPQKRATSPSGSRRAKRKQGEATQPSTAALAPEDQWDRWLQEAAKRVQERGATLLACVLFILLLGSLYLLLQSAKPVLANYQPYREPPREATPEEAYLAAEQLRVLQNRGADVEARLNAVRILEGLGPAAVYQFASDLGELADTEPDEAVRGMLMQLLEEVRS